MEFQKIVKGCFFFLAGIGFIGMILDSLANSISFLTPLMALIISMILSFCYFGTYLWIQKNKPLWETGNGKIRITKPNRQIKLFFAGVIFILWFPVMISLVSPTSDVNSVSESIQDERSYSRDLEALKNFVDYVSEYSNYSTVNWAKVDTLFYRPYNCDWEFNKNLDTELTDNIVMGNPSRYPSHLACKHYHLLQNAKTDVRIKGNKARILATPEVTAKISEFEDKFDLVFQKMIEENYYSRVFPDIYNEVMFNAFEELNSVMSDEK